MIKKIILAMSLAIALFGGAKNWNIFKVENIKIYTVFGENISGDTFGFAKIPKSCDMTLMWLSMGTTGSKIKKYDGKFIKVDFETQHDKFTISVFVSVENHNPIYSVLSYNFVLGDKFINLLKNSKEIKISINPNQEIAKYFSKEPTIFNIEGFKEIFTSANHQCQKDTIDKK